MADGSHIEWTDATWNPITGCSVVSPGCTNCYAMKLAGSRLKHHPSRAGLTRNPNNPVWNGQVRFNEGWLDQPLRWKRPRRIFVCAHGDLFAEGVPDEWIDKVFAVMALAPQHTFQVLTKRAERMRDYLRAEDGRAAPQRQVEFLKSLLDEVRRDGGALRDNLLARHIGNYGWPVYGEAGDWPLPNVWLGVSVEDQARAVERLPLLAATPAAKRFISYEPALSPINILAIGTDVPAALKIDWLISGGESGPNARPAPRQWFRHIREQCETAGIFYFHKQNGEYIDADEWYDGLRSNITRDDKPWRPVQPLNYTDAAILAEVCGREGKVEPQSDGSTLIRVGKKAAGRLLDGVEHNGMPDA